MKALTTYSRLLSQLPEVTEKMVKSLQDKIKKSKKDNLSLDPESWEWAYDWGQKIQAFSFADVFNGTATQKQTKKPDTTEEEVHGYFARNELGVQIVAKVGRSTINHKFPDFTEKDFFVPQEIVAYYKPKGLFEKKEGYEYEYPTTFIYQERKDGNAIYESIVWGGLKNLKNNEIYIVATKPNEQSCFMYKPEGNVLYGKDFISFSSKLTSEDFLEKKKVKVGTTEFETVNPVEANKLLSQNKEWIEDAESTKQVLLGMMRKSSGFMVIGGEPKPNVIKKIPNNTETVYINDEKVLDMNEKRKLKIR